jgi:GNAT superfamily N-acetyltransferase
VSAKTRLCSTREHPELVEVTARWRWEEFSRRDGVPFEGVLADAEATAATQGLMPWTAVLLEDGVPAGTASLVASDLEERPELTPWLAGVVVAPQARGRGLAARLVAAVEQRAAADGVRTLWLYTGSAERIYARLGWSTVEQIVHQGRPCTLMRRDLSEG